MQEKDEEEEPELFVGDCVRHMAAETWLGDKGRSENVGGA